MKKEVIVLTWTSDEAVFVRYTFDITESQRELGKHFNMAYDKAEAEGYGNPMVAFDDTSPAWWEVFDSSRSVAVIWTIEDVKMHRPDLTDEQCMEVLKYIRDNNAELSETSYILQDTADELYPLKDGD
jgi:hypothetical protein